VPVGCTPGDWHRSRITEETLKQPICCAWDFVRSEKAKFQEATAAVDTTKQHLEFIKKKVEEDEQRSRTASSNGSSRWCAEVAPVGKAARLA
jgi:hypothetical protein